MSHRRGLALFLGFLGLLAFRNWRSAVPAPGISTAAHFAGAMEDSAPALSLYTPTILSASEDAGLDPRLLAAILLMEHHGRSGLRQTAELRLAELALFSRNIFGTRMLDLSLGPSQLRISTARWVEDDFGDATDLQDLTLAEMRAIAQPETNISIAAQYLAFLIDRRYPGGLALDSPGGPDRAAVIATEYNIGPRALDQEPVELYGGIAARLVRSLRLELMILDGEPE